MSSSLYNPCPHPHTARNINVAHEIEQSRAGLNARLAVALTKTVGTMECAYVFAGLACVGLAGILGLLNPVVILLVAWISQTFIQLVFLPILSVGQGVLGRKQELQAEEQFHTTVKIFHDVEQIMQHLSAQDAELLSQRRILDRLAKRAVREQ